MSKLWKLVVPAAVAAVLLAGCGPTPTGSTSSSPKPTETIDPSPTPSPVETRTAKPALSELIATPNGIADSLGPLLVPVTQPIVVDDPALAVVEWSDDVCGFGEVTAESGGWLPAYPLTADGKYPFFPNMLGRAMTSPVDWISVQTEEIRTAEGLGIGSTVTELVAEYGTDLTVSTDFDYTAHTLHGSAGQLIFWSQLDEVVVGMTVESGAETPAFNFHTTPCA